MTRITLDNLGRDFGDFTALANMDLTIADGEFVALLGPKGVTTDADDLAPWLSDWRGRYHGAAAASRDRFLEPRCADWCGYEQSIDPGSGAG